jgi:hypothetical protein
MKSQPAILTPADLQHLERDGSIVVKQAFPSASALAMAERGVAGTRGHAAQARILIQTVRGVFDDLLGPGAC